MKPTTTDRHTMPEPADSVKSLNNPVNLGLPVDAALADFRRHLRAEGKSLATLSVYGRGIERFAAFAAERGMPLILDAIRREHVEHFLVSLQDGGARPSTVHTYYRGLRSLFAWAVAEDEIEESPMRNIKPPSIPDEPPAVLTREQVDALLRTVEGKGFEARRDAAIIWLFLDTGMRRGELAGLKLTDLDLDHQVAIVMGKGRRPRSVPFGDRPARALGRYLRARRAHSGAKLDALWLGHKGALGSDGIRQMIERRGRQAGIEGLHAHLFRHTFAHEWQAAGGSESGLMQVAGWRSSAMVRRYGRSAAAERARDEHGRLDLFGPRR